MAEEQASGGDTCVCGHKKSDHDGPGESCGKCDCLYYEHDESEMEVKSGNRDG